MVIIKNYIKKYKPLRIIIIIRYNKANLTVIIFQHLGVDISFYNITIIFIIIIYFLLNDLFKMLDACSI